MYSSWLGIVHVRLFAVAFFQLSLSSPPISIKIIFRVAPTLKPLLLLLLLLLSSFESANERRGGEEEEEREVLSLKAFVRPSKRHTIRRLRSRTAGGKPTLYVSLSLVPFYGGALLPVFASSATNVKSKSLARICATTWSPAPTLSPILSSNSGTTRRINLRCSTRSVSVFSIHCCCDGDKGEENFSFSI